jgi:tetratricopeptide (TPR) repeat protein
MLMTRWPIALFCGIVCIGSVRAESLDERFLIGLRERQLYRLAEKLGTDRWRRDDLSDRERADLAIQLSLLYTEHALASPPEARDALWIKAEQVGAVLAQKWPSNPRRQLVDVQTALVALARGRQLREEAAGTTGAATAAAEALDHLQAASRRLREIAASVDEQLTAHRMRPAGNRQLDGLSPDELESLARNISLQLAIVHHEQSLCFARGTADRDDALLQATDGLETLALQSDADRLVWSARAELATCLRELGKLQPAADRITAWLADQPPADAAARLAAEQVRVLLAAGQIDAALRLSSQTMRSPSIPRDAGGQLALAQLEASSAAWRRAPPAEQKRIARNLMAQVDAIRTRYGAYWARRAELLVGHTLADAGPASDADALLLAAQHLYHNGQTDEAVAAYDRAARLLTQNGDRDQAFQASMSAAAIERSNGNSLSAADRFRQLAASQPRHPRAAEAHAMAIRALAKLMRTATDDGLPRLTESYERLLTEHLTHWGASPTAEDVRWWYGQFLASRGDWAAAIDVLQSIPPTSNHYADAVYAIVDGYEQLLSSFDADDDRTRQSRAATLAAATKHLQQIVTGPENRWPTEWSELQRDVAVSLAQLHVRYSDAATTYPERLLTAALRGTSAGQTDAAAGDWEANVRSLLTLARIRGGQQFDARDYDEALATYARLAREHPDDGELQESYATLLAHGQSEATLATALTEWQQVEQHSRRGGPRWRRARRARIELLERLDRRDEAEKLRRLTRLLYPDWSPEANQ